MRAFCRSLICLVIGSVACAQTTNAPPLVGRPLPAEGTPGWEKIVEPRRAQVVDSIAAKLKLVEAMPQGTLVALDVPYVEHPLMSKFPGSGQLLDLYVPPGKGPFPLVVYVHGGAWNGGNKDKFGAELAAKWMPEGFAVASVSYRFAYDAPFPAMFQDTIDAIDFLRDHAAKYRLNPDKVGLCGNSAGGHIVAVVGVTMGDAKSPFLRAGKAIQALVVWCGYGDVTIETTGKPTGGFPYIYPNLTYDPVIAREMSAVYLLHAGMPPVLIQHGEKDEAVPLLQPRRFAEMMKEGGYDVTLITYPTYTHGLVRLDGPVAQQDVQAAALAFYKKHPQ